MEYGPHSNGESFNSVLSTTLRTFSYKRVNDLLPFSNNIFAIADPNNVLRNMCVFCKIKRDSKQHCFYECQVLNPIMQYVNLICYRIHLLFPLEVCEQISYWLNLTLPATHK